MNRFRVIRICLFLSFLTPGFTFGQEVWTASNGIASTENRIDICQEGVKCSIRAHPGSTQFVINNRSAGPTRFYYGNSLEFAEAFGTAINLRIDTEGRIGVGKSFPQWALDVNGTIRADEIRVTQPGADFVFADDYELMPLAAVEEAIRTHRHLPGIPSAREMAEHGVGVGVMQNQLLQKVEELTLYMIQLKKENDRLAARLDAIGAAK